MFPVINNISDLTSKIEGHQEFGIYPNDNGTTVVCYAIADKDTFRGEDAEYKRECRGITFGPKGEVICRPLHKFHNVGENEESQPHNIPWDKIVRISTKYDGSMITPLLVNGELICKTKRSFNSFEATSALKWLNERPEHKQLIIKWLELGWTPIFEWVSPESPIVLTSYKEPELILLQVRDNEFGSYVDLVDSINTCDITKYFRIAENHIDRFRGTDGIVSWDLMREAAAMLKGEEGWIIQTDDDRFWKVKTDWYFSVHHTMTFLRWRDIFAAGRDGMLDDMRAAFSVGLRDTGVIDFVEDFTKQALEYRYHLALQLASKIDALRHDMQDALIVKLLKNEPMFTEAMRIARGLDVTERIRTVFFRDTLALWSLAVVDAGQLKNWTYSFEEACNIAGFDNIPLDISYLP